MEACREILEEGVSQLDIVSDEEKMLKLLAFIKLMEKWNRTYNLTSVRQKEEMAKLHILDSLVVMPHLQGDCIADIGTGAGLPGIPLAIFLPETQFTLVDSNAKKTRFVQQAVLELQLKNVKVVHNRVEKINSHLLYSTVIMRAFSSLQDIMNLSRHLIAPQGILLAMKGHLAEEELVNFSEPYSIIPLKVPSVDAERCLIRIKGVANHG
jgi:16S rRNA (guanine527-N7)-methyltransferase